MKDRRKRRNILSNLIFSKFFLVFCIFLFLVVLFGLAKGTIRTYKVNSDVEDLQQEISNLEKQNQELSQLMEYLKTDSFIEQEAKLKLGYKKEGEQLVVIPQEEFVFEENKVEVFTTQKNIEKWWYYFFN